MNNVPHATFFALLPFLLSFLVCTLAADLLVKGGEADDAPKFILHSHCPRVLVSSIHHRLPQLLHAPSHTHSVSCANVCDHDQELQLPGLQPTRTVFAPWDRET